MLGWLTPKRYRVKKRPQAYATGQNFLLRSIWRAINSLLDIPHSPLAGWSMPHSTECYRKTW